MLRRRLLVAILAIPLALPSWLSLLHAGATPEPAGVLVGDGLGVDRAPSAAPLHVCALCVFAKSLKVGLGHAGESLAPPLRPTAAPRTNRVGPAVRFAFAVASRSPPRV